MFKSLLLLHLRKALFYFARTLTIEWTHRREYPAQISVHVHASTMGITRISATGQTWSCRTYRNGVWERVTKTRNIKTNILCFEYFEYAEKINPSDFIGKNVRCGGTLSAIEINPNKSKIWVARLKITNAFARVMTPR